MSRRISRFIAIPATSGFCRRPGIFIETTPCPMIGGQEWGATCRMAWERDWTPRHWTGFTLIAASLMLATPLWSVWAPAMPDYPAHLASFALIEQGTFHHGMPGGNAFYHLQWSFVPNLASEVMVPFLAQLTGVV